MRCAALAMSVLALGCTEPRLPTRALPLAAAPARDATIPPAAPSRQGERLTWAISWRGLALGQATLELPEATGATVTATASYRSRGLAARLRGTAFRLTSVLEVATGWPTRSQVIERDDGTTTRIDLRFAPGRCDIETAGAPARHIETTPATRLHTIDSALGALRRWAPAATGRGHLDVIHGDRPYRLEVAPPRRVRRAGQPMVRVDCRGRDVSDTTIEPIAVTLWLSPDRRALPLRIEIVDPTGRLVAELIDPIAS